MCGSAAEVRDPYSGSLNMKWLVCTTCGNRDAVFADESEWQEWDMPVKFVDGCVIVPFEMLK